MRYPERRIASLIESRDQADRLQAVELARVLCDDWTPEQEAFGALVARLGVLMWSEDGEALKRSTVKTDRRLRDACPEWVFGNGFVAFGQARQALARCRRSRRQTDFLREYEAAAAAVAHLPNEEASSLQNGALYLRLTLGGGSRRSRALRLSRVLLSGGVP